MSKSVGRQTVRRNGKRGGKSGKTLLSASDGSRRKASSSAAIAGKTEASGTQRLQQEAKPRLSSLLQSSDFAKYQSGGRRIAAADGRSRAAAAADAPTSWKAAVQRYVRLYNQAETEQHGRVLTDYVADEVHHQRLNDRMERLRERDLLRGALPKGSETKAEIVRVHESASEVIVLLRLHVRRTIEQGRRLYTEDRCDYERLWLYGDRAEWRIMQVEPVMAERRPRYGQHSHPAEASFGDSVLEEGIIAPSMPYLNYDLFPHFKNRMTGIAYRRDMAAAYADRWWNEGNPEFELFEVNCTNYVSQSIFAGSAPMNYTGNRGSGWWYKGRAKGQEWWSYSWAVSHSLANYLSASRKSGLRASVVERADELMLGDVIVYDWNGDGRFEHSTIVTAFDAAGMPLVNANTVASRHRYWDYQDSYAWTPRTKYRFFHIADLL